MPTTAFSPTRRSASAARPARSRARNGTTCPADGFEWTGRSYDNTGGLGHSTWRHVKFVEHACATAMPRVGRSRPTSASTARTPGASRRVPPDRSSAPSSAASSSSPTSATAAATASSPARSASSIGGPTTGARSSARSATTGRRPGCEPACAKACPTESIQFGDLDELRASARRRASTELHARGIDDAVVYDPRDTSVGGTHAIFLVRGDVRAFNLPSNPQVPTVYLRDGWAAAAATAAMLIAGTLAAFAGGRRRLEGRSHGA